MNAAHKMAARLLEICSITNIRHVRDEHVESVEHHGGEIGDLNDKLAAHANKVEAQAVKLRRQLLG